MGVVCFRLTPDQVWRLTPAQFAALSDQLDNERRIFDYQMGWIRACLVEPYRDKEKHPESFKPEDFCVMPPKDGTERKGAASSGEMTPDEMLAHVRGYVIPTLREHNAKMQALREGR